MGGVRKFYEVKGKARPEMARHIARHIEKELFSRWKSGAYSLIQLRQFTDALVVMLDERLALLTDKTLKMPSEMLVVQARIAELSTQFNKVGFLGKHLTDKRGTLFSDIGAQSLEQYILNTRYQGLKFACSLIPFVKEQLLNLRGNIDVLHQNLTTATEKINFERAARLGQADAVYQKRIFDQNAIAGILKAIITDEAAQAVRTQRVRQALIDLGGTDVDSFDQLQQGISLGSMISTLSQESAQIVELAHAEIARMLPPVLHVNIIERLQKKYDANPSGLRTFVSELYDEAGSMMIFNKTEVDRCVANNAGGTRGRAQTVGVFLPECENQKGFRNSLAALFNAQKDPASDTSVAAGKLSNQIVIIKIASLMPARFVDSLGELKRHYDGLLADDNESVLLHSEGDGKRLPPLFARSTAEVNAEARRKPYLLVARLLGMIKERQNKTSGLIEWVFSYISGGLPKVVVLGGKSWADVIEGDYPAGLQGTIEKEVNKRIDAEYKHIDKKAELRTAYQQMVMSRFIESGEDDQDAEFVALAAMQKQLLEILGLPRQDD